MASFLYAKNILLYARVVTKCFNLRRGECHLTRRVRGRAAVRWCIPRSWGTSGHHSVCPLTWIVIQGRAVTCLVLRHTGPSSIEAIRAGAIVPCAYSPRAVPVAVAPRVAVVAGHAGPAVVGVVAEAAARHAVPSVLVLDRSLRHPARWLSCLLYSGSST